MSCVVLYTLNIAVILFDKTSYTVVKFSEQSSVVMFKFRFHATVSSFLEKHKVFNTYIVVIYIILTV